MLGSHSCEAGKQEAEPTCYALEPSSKADCMHLNTPAESTCRGLEQPTACITTHTCDGWMDGSMQPDLVVGGVCEPKSTSPGSV